MFNNGTHFIAPDAIVEKVLRVWMSARVCANASIAPWADTLAKLSRDSVSALMKLACRTSWPLLELIPAALIPYKSLFRRVCACADGMPGKNCAAIFGAAFV